MCLSDIFIMKYLNYIGTLHNKFNWPSWFCNFFNFANPTEVNWKIIHPFQVPQTIQKILFYVFWNRMFSYKTKDNYENNTVKQNAK